MPHRRSGHRCLLLQLVSCSSVHWVRKLRRPSAVSAVCPALSCPVQASTPHLVRKLSSCGPRRSTRNVQPGTSQRAGKAVLLPRGLCGGPHSVRVLHLCYAGVLCPESPPLLCAQRPPSLLHALQIWASTSARFPLCSALEVAAFLAGPALLYGTSAADPGDMPLNSVTPGDVAAARASKMKLCETCRCIRPLRSKHDTGSGRCVRR